MRKEKREVRKEEMKNRIKEDWRKTQFEKPQPNASPKTGHEVPRVAIELGTPQDCGGTEQAEEY